MQLFGASVADRYKLLFAQGTQISQPRMNLWPQTPRRLLAEWGPFWDQRRRATITSDLVQAGVTGILDSCHLNPWDWEDAATELPVMHAHPPSRNVEDEAPSV